MDAIKNRDCLKMQGASRNMQYAACLQALVSECAFFLNISWFFTYDYNRFNKSEL
jgi:hypothetical protein